MLGARHYALWSLGVIVAGIAAVTSCASSDRPSAGRTDSDTAAAAASFRKTQQEVQAELMAFADRYFAANLDVAQTLEHTLNTPETRYNAAAARLVALVATTDIAASPNAGAALLDMAVFVTLRRMVWEQYWMPEVYGENGRPVLDTLRELEDDIWQIAAGVYTPDQLNELRELIDDWRSQHPDTRAVDFVRLSELGNAKKAQTLMDAARPGGMLAPVKQANREFEEMRLLAERLAFMVTRMQVMATLQFSLASAQLATQPEFRQLLEDSRTFADVSDRAAETFATLVADFPEERRAAIDQFLRGMSEERAQIVADLTAEDSGLRPTLGDFQSTFEAGRQLADKLDEAVISADRLVARMLEKEPARPFDILDYKATIEEATRTAQEVQTALSTIERILSSPTTGEDLNVILAGAERLEDEVIDDVIDRTFLRGVALILVFFIVLTLYRLLMRRVAPDLLGWAPKDKR